MALSVSDSARRTATSPAEHSCKRPSVVERQRPRRAGRPRLAAPQQYGRPVQPSQAPSPRIIPVSTSGSRSAGAAKKGKLLNAICLHGLPGMAKIVTLATHLRPFLELRSQANGRTKLVDAQKVRGRCVATDLGAPGGETAS